MTDPMRRLLFAAMKKAGISRATRVDAPRA